MQRGTEGARRATARRFARRGARIGLLDRATFFFFSEETGDAEAAQRLRVEVCFGSDFAERASTSAPGGQVPPSRVGKKHWLGRVW